MFVRCGLVWRHSSLPDRPSGPVAADGGLLPSGAGLLGTGPFPELVGGSWGSRREANRFSFLFKQHPACVWRPAPPLRPAVTRHVSEACAQAACRTLLGAVVTRPLPGVLRGGEWSSLEQTRVRASHGSSSGERQTRKPSPKWRGLCRGAHSWHPLSWRGRAWPRACSRWSARFPCPAAWGSLCPCVWAFPPEARKRVVWPRGPCWRVLLDPPWGALGPVCCIRVHTRKAWVVGTAAPAPIRPPLLP